MNILETGRLLYKEHDLYYFKLSIFILIFWFIILGLYLITLRIRTPYDNRDMWLLEYTAFVSLILGILFLGSHYWNKHISHIEWFAIYENGIRIITLEDNYFIQFDRIIIRKLESIGNDRRYFQIESGKSWKIIVGNHPSIKGVNFISKNIDEIVDILDSIKKY